MFVDKTTQPSCTKNETNAVEFFENGTCFVVKRINPTDPGYDWNAANRACASDGETFAKIETEAANSGLQAVLQRVLSGGNAWNAEGAWIGLTRSEWNWINGGQVFVWLDFTLKELHLFNCAFKYKLLIPFLLFIVLIKLSISKQNAR